MLHTGCKRQQPISSVRELLDRLAAAKWSPIDPPRRCRLPGQRWPRYEAGLGLLACVLTRLTVAFGADWIYAAHVVGVHNGNSEGNVETTGTEMSFEPTRREFLYQSVGLAAATRLSPAAAVTPRIWSGFPMYSQFRPKVPVWCVTPKLQGCLHRFFDSSPVSPSGRYLGVTRLRDETRMPAFGDAADIVVVDLTTGDTEVVAQTRGFGTQVGAQVQWGATDQDLFYSDVDTEKWHVFTVHMNPLTRAKRTLNGPLYMVSPNGKQIHLSLPPPEPNSRNRAMA